MGIYLTFAYILGAFGTRVITIAYSARPYLAPRSLFVIMATGAFVRQILMARAAVKTACHYEFFVCFDILHISNALQSDEADY